MNERSIALAKDLAREFEGLQLNAYRCPAGVLTIGYGHTGRDVRAGLNISEDRAEELLDADMTASMQSVLRLVHIDLTDEQAAALADFDFNLGSQNLASSTLLTKLNGGDFDSIPDELRKWIYGSGEKLPGLVRRREAEAQLWMKS